MAGIKDELFQIGWLAADVLKQFAEIQDNIRSWRVAIFVPVDFSQHEQAVLAVKSHFEEIMTRLETVIPHIHPGSKEDDLAQALGHYICAVINAVSAYEYLTRLIGFYSKRNRLRGLIKVWGARRAFDHLVKEYLDKGLLVQGYWKEMFEVDSSP